MVVQPALNKNVVMVGGPNGAGKTSWAVENLRPYPALAPAYVRPANRKEDRIDRRLVQNRTGTRRVVVAMRQRRGRTLTGVFRAEDEALGMIQERVRAGSLILADEASSWDGLHAWYTAKRINHSLAFSDNGACTNQAESFFSRLRRMVGGQRHKVSGNYLDQYAGHAAWLEDHRRSITGPWRTTRWHWRSGMACHGTGRDTGSGAPKRAGRAPRRFA